MNANSRSEHDHLEQNTSVELCGLGGAEVSLVDLLCEYFAIVAAGSLGKRILINNLVVVFCGWSRHDG